MTDKSFGEHSNRNSVRNPLLSSAVVGVSLEDLTHYAVLLPAAQNSALIGGQDAPTMLPAPARAPEPTDRTDNPPNQSQRDDFDVNEYIARLQGSRYVSAPINALVDTNMNETEDLEEINLNDVEEQSLTADIAQNFSQLPSVLPQVASAVFSSLSNMMRVRREDTEVDAYQGVHFEGHSLEPRVAESVERPPLTEPPVGSTGSTYRMTSKKKAYAQIPGLSNNNAVLMQPTVPQQNAESISYFTPNFSQEQTVLQQNFGHPEPINSPSTAPYIDSSIPMTLKNEFIQVQNFAPTAFGPAIPPTVPIPSENNPSQALPPRDTQASSSSEVAFGIPSQNLIVNQKSQASIAMFPSNLGTESITTIPQKQTEYAMPPSVPQKTYEVTHLPQNSVPPIIPPPTMFSNTPRRDSKTDVGRTILPPSVARRLASQPVIKAPPSLTKFEANIFVPAPVGDEKAEAALSSDLFNATPLASLSVKSPEESSVSMFGHTTAATNLEEHSKPQPTTFDPTANVATSPFFTPTIPSEPSQLFGLPQSDVNPSIFAPHNQSSFNPTSLPEPPKVVPEPPKMAAGGLSYRMTKKRPQYYSGPIEGVGAISNNFKPVIAPTDQQGFVAPVNLDPGQLFTPEAKETTPFQPPEASAPFDLSRPIESQNVGFSIQSSVPSSQIEATWDLSRPTTNSFEPPKQETTGFGLIGSLKSKLGSLDINKIQTKVTTFFDPAYNDTVKQEQFPTQIQTGGQSTLDLFVVTPQQYGQNQTYGQDYPQAQNFYEYPQNQYNSQEYYNQSQSQSYYQTPNVQNQPPLDQTNVPQTSDQYSANWPRSTEQTYYGNQYHYQDTLLYQQSASKSEETPLALEPKTDVNIVSSNPFGYQQEQSINTITYQQPEVQTSEPMTAEAKVTESIQKANPLFGYNEELPKEILKEEAQSEIAEVIDTSFSSQDFEPNPAIPPIGVPMFARNAEKTFFDQPINQSVNKSSIIQSDGILPVKTKPDEASNMVYNPISLVTQPAGSFFDLQLPGKTLPDAFKNDDNPKPADVQKTEINTDCIKLPEKPPVGITPSGFFVKCLEPDLTAANFFDDPEALGSRADVNLLPKPIESLLQEKVPISSLPGEVVESITTSSVIRDIAKELALERRLSLSDRKPSNVGFVPYKPTEIGASKEVDKDGAPLVENAIHIFTQNQSFIDNGSEMEFIQRSNAQNYHDHESDLDICETCREVNRPEEEATNLTQKLIENITSPIQLSNPVEVPLVESNDPIEDLTDVANNICAEITQITEETIETLHAQAALELLDDDIIENFDKNLKLPTDVVQEQNYGWSNSAVQPVLDSDYSFHTDPNAIGFSSNNSLFFDDIPKNASDEIKAEFKSAYEDSPTNNSPRQMNLPTAPPADDIEDNKSDGTGLDVISIEQDANKDFLSYEDYVIEPSETDDDKIDYKERDRTSDDPTPDIDSFTNRVEKFKQTEVESESDKSPSQMFEGTAPALTVASYFDTGNYAAESYYQKSLMSPNQGSVVSSPPNQSQPVPSVLPPMPQYSTLANLVAQNNQPFQMNVEKAIHELTDSPTYSSNIFKSESITQFPDIIKDTKMCGDGKQKPEISSDFAGFGTDQNTQGFGYTNDLQEVKRTEEKPVETLPDPIDFFASSKTEEKQETAQSEGGYNRLASYFSSPKKTEQTKPFFELSQGQDHLRKEAAKPTTQSFFDLSQSQNHYMKNPNIPLDLMKDLTSVDNYVPSKDQVVKHVNYFTVHYDNAHFNRTEKATVRNVEEAKVIGGDKARVDMKKQDVKLKKAMEGGTDAKDSPSPSQKESPSKQMNVTFNVPIDEEKEENQALVSPDGRATSEYVPVKHHWFYRVDCEGRSIWKGFSNVDSNALEDAFHSPSLSEQTLVPTDGGRFDVNVMGRLRIPVYWSEKPTNVRRCSWFYKGTTDARYVPYSEDLAERLEEEYRHGVTLGAWHRRLSLPNNEAVVLHTPAVMVHVLQSPNIDWGGTRVYLWSKKVYRNPLKIKFKKDQNEKVDHLLLMVHGAGEAGKQKEKLQSTMRPRVVRRSHEESEIEDLEPSRVDHLLLLCHGVGSACDMRFRAVEEVVDDFRATSLQLIQGHYRRAYDTGEIGRVEVLPVSWHGSLHAGERGVDARLAAITLESIPRLRSFTNEAVLDILFYTSPVYCQTIIDTVCSEVNRIYKLFKERNPAFSGGVSLGGHSLGSVILYDLLCHQTPEKPIHSGSHCVKQSVPSPAAGQPRAAYPTLDFAPEALYALGSPIAMFECTRGVAALGEGFALPTCRRFFNIFHPYDPIAYRVEPLINPELKDVPPSLIPHHKGRKRMHLELKETMARVGADLKQKIFESLKATWSSVWRAPPPAELMKKVVEEEIEKNIESQEEKIQLPQDVDQKTLEKMGKLNGGRRVDYVLQEAPFEMINEYLFAVSSHVGYWESEDTMLLILREIYDALGVRPDGSLPPPTLSVLREEEVMDPTDKPSTSHT